MMYGRKKHLLDSYNAASAAGGEPASQREMAGPTLNLNQSLTEQLTQQHRRGHGDVGRRTPPPVHPRLSPPDAAPPRGVDGETEAPRGGGGRAASSPSPARGSRRAAAEEPPPPARPTRSPPPPPELAFAAGMNPITARLALQHQLAAGLFPPPPPHPALHPPSFLLPPADSSAGITQHLELLYRVKYPGYPVPPAWLLYQYQDELVRDAALLQQQAAASEHQQHAAALRDRDADRSAAIRDRQDR